MILVCFLISLITISVFGQEEAPVVTIPDGQLRGTARLTFKENVTYFGYRGIPYAEKPLSDLRFAPPVKNKPWTGILNATEDRDSCTQLLTLLGIGSSEPQVIGSEDCLYINVYTTNVTGSLPVMVWIYGGGFVGGTSAYDIFGPDYFLEKNVVYVAFNYRVGIFGFLSTEDLAAPGNWGLKDQILALKWVKQNIKHFGGDPEKITIFGESAGSASVGYLLQSPLTAGLYRSAIMQSGTSLCSWALSRNARRKAFTVGAKLGIITLNSETLVRNLRKVDYKTLKLAEDKTTTTAFLTENLLGGLPFGVVQEPIHTGAVFSGKSWQLLSNGNFQKVSIIIGQTSNEAASLEAYTESIGPILFQYDLDIAGLAPYDLTRDWFKRLAAGAEVRGHYFGPGPLGSQAANVTKFLTVDLFKRAIREAATRISRFSNTFYYEFSYKGPLGDPNNTLRGVGHAEELRYLFVSRDRSVDESDSKMIDRFVTFWTNFAKTGNPTPPNDSEGEPVLGELTWEPNNSSTNADEAIKYLDIGSTLKMATNPLQLDWEFYQRLYRIYGETPYGTY